MLKTAQRLFIVCSLSFAALASAAIGPGDVIPVLDGQPFSNITQIKGQDGVRSVQYVRQGETVSNWGRSATYSRVRSAAVGDDPKNVAGQLVGALRKIAPNAEYTLSASKDQKTMLLDFAYFKQSTGYVEFSIYRLERMAAGEGVYSVGFIVRVPMTAESQAKAMAELSRIRGNLIQVVSGYDMVKVKEILDNLPE